MCAAARRDEGIEVYRALWREDEKDSPGRFARDVLNHVDRGAAGARLMLPKFPTVTQKRNYCGPATLELVLRSLGLDVDQDDIAPEVKRERGSSILAMCRYLESKGLVTRRFEGDGPRFRACIEQGLPVIVEEEYSTTSHVAVVIGVDESLGLLFVQDPMTHVTSERQISAQGTLGAMYRNAAIVALRPGDDTRASALDQAGVTDSEHLRLVDSCADDEVAKDNEEILQRCDRALALVEDYPLAWYRRTSCLMSQYFRFRTQNNRERFVTELRRARVRFHDQEWPHLLHASYLMDSDRHEEALIELENALRIDKYDSNTAQDIAECHMQQGRAGEATTAFWKTLEIDAGHVRATENFTGHALDQGELDVAEHLSACSLELSPANPFNHVTASRVADRRGRLDDALAHARKAIEVGPEYVWGSLRLAELLRKVGTEAARSEAIDLYLALVTKRPYWFEPRWRGARELERQGRVEEAAELLVAGLEIAQDEPVVLVRNLADILLEAGDDERAAELSGQFARQRPTPSMLERWWDTLDETDRWSEAAEAAGEFLASNQDSPFACASRASRIYGMKEHDEEAERLLRHAIEGAPTYGWARRMLGDLLFRDHASEAIELLADAPAGEEWNDVYRASYLAYEGRYDDARAVLDTVDDTGWTSQEIWNRAALRGEDAASAADRLADSTTPRDRRALLAFAAAAQQWERAESLLAELDVTDPIAQYMCHAAVGTDDRFRGELDRRIEARLAKDPDHAVRRYLLAVKAGNRAAQGDREAFDRMLAEERNVSRLASTSTALSRWRNADLLRELRSALTRRPDRAAGLLAVAELAEMDRDHARAAAACAGAGREAAARLGGLDPPRARAADARRPRRGARGDRARDDLDGAVGARARDWRGGRIPRRRSRTGVVALEPRPREGDRVGLQRARLSRAARGRGRARSRIPRASSVRARRPRIRAARCGSLDAGQLIDDRFPRRARANRADLHTRAHGTRRAAWPRMRLAAAAVITLAIATSPARADGVYLSEALGPGVVHDQLASDITTTTFRAKVALGMRFGGWALEPFVAAESTDPGGDAFTSPTLTSYGVDSKRLVPVSRHVSVYVRGSMSHIAYPDQSPCCYDVPLLLPYGYGLWGYSGRGLGVGIGAQYSTKIPFLGLRGGVFVEDSYDYYRLLAPSGSYYGNGQIDGFVHAPRARLRARQRLLGEQRARRRP